MFSCSLLSTTACWGLLLCSAVTAMRCEQHAEVRSACADEDLERVRQGFLGAIQQEPPMFSALKLGGERLYAKARRGEACALTIDRRCQFAACGGMLMTDDGSTRFVKCYFGLGISFIG